MTVTTNPPTPGSWAWLPDDNGSRAHWRPQNYWAPGTTVSLDAKLYGLDFGDGAYGAEDLSLNFTIGRSQIVIANAPATACRWCAAARPSWTSPSATAKATRPATSPAAASTW